MIGRRRSARVECPICLHRLDWARARVVALDDAGEATPFLPRPGESESARRMRLTAAYRVCTGDGTTHYLPYDYGEYDDRIVVGVIGASAAGKSHLLAAMIGRLLAGSAQLKRLGLRVDPLDLRVHNQYMRDVVQPFMAGRELRPTPREQIEFTDAFRVTNDLTGRRCALTFFDVAGEVLEDVDPGVSFIGAVNALLFVIDPEAVPRLVRPDAAATRDNAFDVSLGKLQRIRNPRHRPFLPIPSASVVVKADRLRFRSELVRRWLDHDGDEEFDLSTLEAESRDVYAYLSARGATGWLAPAEQCLDSTLHFASATGTQAEDGRFPALTFRQRRVLKPLLALLAMKGVAGHAEAGVDGGRDD
ncbi:hypothetical protein DMA12_21090 [Amycolatopsis balhimycina DSM 5908]|uniref:Uncharacterized protein n=1 Tax=Amycolatopsis balhimycina DSM 5908 TaxID=1081091 RepID=A0A428WI22_AMYBA|nr:hypothetical protein [Amycolatopsis balhimycina]RSM42717.1 hypothetical protein DMA12_21090 [Amycolatopsis balhimycina DSM 5908]